MPTVRFEGWQTEFQPLAFISLLKTTTGWSLLEAKDAKDQLLAGAPLYLVVPTAEAAEKLLTEGRQLGAKGELL